MLDQNSEYVIHNVGNSDSIQSSILQGCSNCSITDENSPQFKGFSTDKVIQGLQNIPDYCALTPVNEKKPYRKNWNKEQPVSRKNIINDIRSGKATGYGLRTGEVSNGLLAIDVDGFSAEEKLQELSKGDLPETVSWTSGKPGRRQIIYKVKPEHWHLAEKLTIIKTGKNEQLDPRWNGKQSVLPPSKHPETGEYKWINSPSNTEIADCPDRVINMMLDASTKEGKVEKVKSEKTNDRPRPEQKVPAFRVANDTHFDYPSLRIYLTNDDKNLILAGANEGSRNEAARKLSINLVATERKAERLGFICHDTALDLYEFFCSRCTPPLEDSEASKWFTGAESKASQWKTSLDEEYMTNRHNAWMKRKYGIGQEPIEKVVSLIHNENSKKVEQENLNIPEKNQQENLAIHNDEKLNFKSERAVAPERFKRWLERQEFTPDIVVNQASLKLPPLPKEPSVISINAFMGCGKTEEAIRVIATREKENVVSFLLANRNRLLFQTNQRASEVGVKIYHLNEDDGMELLADSSIHQSLCPESIKKIDGYFEGRDLWIDEACSVLGQILGGGTVKGSEQALCIEVLSRAFNTCNHVFLLDANLRDIDVDLVSKKAPNKPVVKIFNEHPPRLASFTFVQSVVQTEEELCVKETDKSPLIAKALENNQVPCIASDSRTFTKTLHVMFQNHEKWGFTLNQDTSEETWGEFFSKNQAAKIALADLKIDLKAIWSKELMETPNEFFKRYKPQFFIYSPTAESGVSITIKDFFTIKIAFFFGVISTNSQMQMLFRLRDNTIPGYIWCPDKSRIRNMQDTERKTAEYIANAVQEQMKHSIAILKSPNIEEIFKKALRRIDNDWFNYGYILEEIEAFEKDYLRSCLMYKLEKLGHTVSIEQEKKLAQLTSEAVSVKKALDLQKAEQMFHSQAFSSIDEANRIAKKDKTYHTALRVQKTLLIHRNPGIEEEVIWSEMYIFHNIRHPKFRSELEMYWLLYNPEVLEKQTDLKLFKKLTSENVSASSLRRTIHLTIWGLRQLGIVELIGMLRDGAKLSKDSKVVQEIVKKARTDKGIKKIPGFYPGKETATGQEVIPFIKKLLRKVGVELKSDGKKVDESGEERRWYSLSDCFNEPYRICTLRCIQRFFEKWLAEEYKKPDWGTYLEEGKAIPLNNEQSKKSSKFNFKATDFQVLTSEGLIDYKNPGLAVIKAAGEYFKYCKGFIAEITTSSADLITKGMKLLEDMEIYSDLKTEIMNSYPLDFYAI